AKSALWEPFATIPATFDAASRDRLTTQARAAIADDVTPAYRRFLDFMTKDYVPHARTTLAATALPDGAAYYQYLVKKFTTTDVTPEQIHKIGLDQVARIRAEMDDAIKKTGFKGTFPQFLQFLRTDPRFYAKTPEELLKDAAYIAKRMDG